MPKDASIDIDDIDDFRYAEYLSKAEEIVLEQYIQHNFNEPNI